MTNSLFLAAAKQVSDNPTQRHNSTTSSSTLFADCAKKVNTTHNDKKYRSRTMEEIGLELANTSLSAKTEYGVSYTPFSYWSTHIKLIYTQTQVEKSEAAKKQTRCQQTPSKKQIPSKPSVPTIKSEIDNDLIQEVKYNRALNLYPEQITEIKKTYKQELTNRKPKLIELRDTCENKYYPPSTDDDGNTLRYYDIEEDISYQMEAIDALKRKGAPTVACIGGLCGIPWHLGFHTIANGGNCRDEFEFLGSPSTIAIDNFVSTLDEIGLIQLVNKNHNVKVMCMNGRLCPIEQKHIDEEKARQKQQVKNNKRKRVGRCWGCPKIEEEEAELRALLLKPYIKCCTALGITFIYINLSGKYPKENGSDQVMEIVNREENIVPVHVYELLHMQFFETGAHKNVPKQLQELSEVFSDVYELSAIIDEVTELTKKEGVTANMKRVFSKKKTFDDLFIEKAGKDFTSVKTLRAAQKDGLKRYRDRVWNEKLVSHCVLIRVL